MPDATVRSPMCILDPMSYRIAKNALMGWVIVDSALTVYGAYRTRSLAGRDLQAIQLGHLVPTTTDEGKGYLAPVSNSATQEQPS